MQNLPCMVMTQPLTALVSQLKKCLRLCDHPFHRLIPGSTQITSRSSFMFLGNTKNSDYPQDVTLNNVKLEHTSSTKLLGLHIHVQTDVAWKKHITFVAKSLSSKIGLFLRLLRQILKI